MIPALRMEMRKVKLGLPLKLQQARSRRLDAAGGRDEVNMDLQTGVWMRVHLRAQLGALLNGDELQPSDTNAHSSMVRASLQLNV